AGASARGGVVGSSATGATSRDLSRSVGGVFRFDGCEGERGGGSLHYTADPRQPAAPGSAPGGAACARVRKRFGAAWSPGAGEYQLRTPFICDLPSTRDS